jgi:prepilin-type N-terminal cleavage/methylation domain-containing protein/prepilin-type processing-associated H-X9-DG protein
MDLWQNVDTFRQPGGGSAKRSKAAFTLIELLVVIAVIALLAAILFPVFQRVREKARQTSCANNMREIATAFTQYREDNDGRYPQAWDLRAGATTADFNTSNTQLDLSTPNYSPVVWPAKLEPYLKNRQIFSCPDLQRIRRSPCAGTSSTLVAEWKATDPVVGAPYSSAYTGASQIAYGYNVQFLGGGQFAAMNTCQHTVRPSAGNCYTCGTGALESTIAKPSETILMTENTWENVGTGGGGAFADPLTTYDLTGDSFWCTATGANSPGNNFDTRHNDGMNVAFTDGHVKWLQRDVVVYKPFSGAACNNLTGFASDSRWLWDRE